MHREALRQLLSQDLPGRVIVIGDVFLRHVVLGEAETLSPDAPIPILRTAYEEFQLGGAGEIAAILASLGARPTVVSLLGQDEEACWVRRLLDQYGIASADILTARGSRTKVEMRILGQCPAGSTQQMLQVEWPGPSAQSAAQFQTELLRRARCLLERECLMLVVRSEMARPELCAELIKAAQSRKARVMIQPPATGHWEACSGADYAVAHTADLPEAAANQISSLEEASSRLAELVQSYGIRELAILSGRDGLLWAGRHFGIRHLGGGCAPRGPWSWELAQLLAVGAFIHAAGGDWQLAWELFQVLSRIRSREYVAGRIIPGPPVAREDLLAALKDSQDLNRSKILRLDEAISRIELLRVQRKQLVLASGYFDYLHPGQVAALEWAKTLGDCLMVVVRNDPLKEGSKGRGGMPEGDRASLLASLECVDLVVTADELGLAKIIHDFRPEVVVKGVEHPWEQIVGWHIIEQYGGRIVTVPIGMHRVAPRIAHPLNSVPAGSANTADPASQRKDEEPVVLRFPKAA